MLKLIILSLLATSVFAADEPEQASKDATVVVAEPAKAPEATKLEPKKINDGLLVTYFKARAEAAEANAVAAGKQTNLTSAINDLRVACPTVTLDAGTGMPTCIVPVPAKPAKSNAP